MAKFIEVIEYNDVHFNSYDNEVLLINSNLIDKAIEIKVESKGLDQAKGCILFFGSQKYVYKGSLDKLRRELNVNVVDNMGN